MVIPERVKKQHKNNVLRKMKNKQYYVLKRQAKLIRREIRNIKNQAHESKASLFGMGSFSGNYIINMKNFGASHHVTNSGDKGSRKLIDASSTRIINPGFFIIIKSSSDVTSGSTDQTLSRDYEDY